MATSSAAAGFLRPDPAPSPVPAYDDALEDVFHDTIVGITGIANEFVRPRWQPNPPNQPGGDVDWVAFGVVSTKKDWVPWLHLDPTLGGGAGGTIFERDEELIVLHSFYGPNHLNIQSRYEDGLFIEQNRDLLRAAGIKLINVQEAYNVPALLKEKWVKKVDQRVVFRRRIRRTYSIRYLLSANVTLDNEQYLTQIVVTPPP